MRKKILSGLLSFALLLSCFNVTYSAEPITTEDGFVINTITVGQEELLAVVGYTGTDTNITIPVSCEYGEIKAIESGAFYSTGIESVIIPTSITKIANYAFNSNYNLKYIVISSGTKLSSLSDDIFYECTSLESITIPKEINYIAPNAISGNYKFQVHGDDWLETEGFYLHGIYYPILKQTAEQEYAKKFYHDYVPSLSYSITDVSMNKTTDLDDVTLALKYALTIDTPSTSSKYFADTNSDGEITLDDVTKILKVALTIDSI